MKPIQTISLLSLLFYLPLYADEVLPTISVEQNPIPVIEVEIETLQPSISSETTAPTEDNPVVIQTSQETTPLVISPLQKLLTQVKEAPNEQKRVLMNQLKVQLKTMNKESRQKAMMELKKSFTKSGNPPKAPQHQQQPNHESCQHGNHQPKFRHLRQSPQDGSGPHRGEGQRGQGGGAGHQGEGGK